MAEELAVQAVTGPLSCVSSTFPAYSHDSSVRMGRFGRLKGRRSKAALRTMEFAGPFF